MKSPSKNVETKMYTIYGHRFFKYEFATIPANSQDVLILSTPRFNVGQIDYIKIYCKSENYNIIMGTDKNKMDGTINESTVLVYDTINKFYSDSKIGAYVDKSADPDTQTLYLHFKNTDAVHETDKIYIELLVMDMDN